MRRSVMTRRARSPSCSKGPGKHVRASSALAILRRQTQAEWQGPCWAHVCRMGREEQGQIAGALEELFLGLSHGFLSSRYYQHHCTETMFDCLLSVIRDYLWDVCVCPRVSDSRRCSCGRRQPGFYTYSFCGRSWNMAACNGIFLCL